MQIYYDFTGFIHFISACIALVAGTAVLILKKGSRTHKIIGYIYSLAMSAVFFTSFMIYRLYDGFGIFHVLATIGILTLAAGILPMLIFKKTASIISIHLSFMYWSVIGLYGAFVSETAVRLKLISFYNMLGVATALVMGVASYLFLMYKNKWEKNYT